MSENALDGQQAAEAQAPAPKKKRMGLVLALVVLAAAGAGGAWYAGYLPGARQGEPQAEAKPPIYYELASNMVANFRVDRQIRYLQVSIEVMTHDPSVVEVLDSNAPVLRNDLIMLLSDQSYDELATREGKQHLQDTALAAIQKLVHDRYGKDGVEALYFTSFVMQ